MNEEETSISAALSSWEELRAHRPFNGILLGNGASIAVWDKFRYQSLFEVAQQPTLTHHLSPEDQDFFAAMDGTTNFEQVLYALWTADKVCNILDTPLAEIRARYESIQNALFAAVHQVHLHKREQDEPIYTAIGRALRDYRVVFSTNYDLLVYWAMMTQGQEGFKDYFWNNNTFNLADTEIWQPANCTRVLYLHGGIHLARTPIGETIKRVSQPDANLLESLGDLEFQDAVPLFVTEGRADDKLMSIRRSDYLSFAYERFGRHNASLVIFGSSLGTYDQHLINAIRSWRERTTIAIGMRRASPVDIIARKAECRRQFPTADLFFFDSATHPLGAASLKIREDENG